MKKVSVYLQDYIIKNNGKINFLKTKYINGAVNIDIEREMIFEHGMFRPCNGVQEYREYVRGKDDKGTLVCNIPDRIALFFEDSNGTKLDDAPNLDYIVIIKTKSIFDEFKKEISSGQYKDYFQFFG